MFTRILEFWLIFGNRVNVMDVVVASAAILKASAEPWLGQMPARHWSSHERVIDFFSAGSRSCCSRTDNCGQRIITRLLSAGVGATLLAMVVTLASFSFSETRLECRPACQIYKYFLYASL